MTQTKTLSFLAKLREKHQALAKAAAVSGIIPPSFSDDPTFADLVTSFSGTTLDE